MTAGWGESPICPHVFSIDTMGVGDLFSIPVEIKDSFSFKKFGYNDYLVFFVCSSYPNHLFQFFLDAKLLFMLLTVSLLFI